MTLRQAMQLLGQEGLITTRHGRGTFVAERPLSYQMRTLRSLAQEMEAQGQALTTTVLDQVFGIGVERAQETIRAVELGAAEARVLEAAAASPAILSERLTFTTGDRPIIYDEAFMPGDRVVVSADRFRSDLTVGYQLRPRGVGVAMA